MQQVALDELAPPVLEALRQLVGNLDDRGYLAQPPADDLAFNAALAGAASRLQINPSSDHQDYVRHAFPLLSAALQHA